MRYILFAFAFLFIPLKVFAGSPATSNSGYVYCDGGEYQQIKYAVIDDASSGDNTLVAAVSGRKIRVLSYTIIPSADVTVRFESGAGGTALTGQMVLLAEDGVVSGGVSVNCAPFGCFETAEATLLNLELSGAVSVDGHLTYVEC